MYYNCRSVIYFLLVLLVLKYYRSHTFWCNQSCKHTRKVEISEGDHYSLVCCCSRDSAGAAAAGTPTRSPDSGDRRWPAADRPERSHRRTACPDSGRACSGFAGDGDGAGADDDGATMERWPPTTRRSPTMTRRLTMSSTTSMTCWR